MPARSQRIPVVVNANPLKLVGISLALAIPGAIAGAVLFGNVALTIVSTVVVLVVGLAWRYFRIVHRIAQRLRDAAPETPADEWIPNAIDKQITAEMVVLGVTQQNWPVLRTAAEQAMERHGPGILYEWHQPSHESQPEPPIDVPIEPTLLRPGVRTPSQEGQPPDSMGERVKKAVEMVTSFYGDGPRMRVIVLILMVFGFLSLGYAFYQAMQQFMTGRVPDLVWQLGLGVMVGLAISIPRQLKPQQWLAVNGGVFIRSSTWRRSGWDLHRLTPENAVLIYWRNLNLLAAYTTESKYYARPITPDEFNLLDQAWRSSIEAPPAEQLSDWQ